MSIRGMLTLTARRGPRCRTSVVTQNCYASLSHEINTQRWPLFATGVSVSHVFGLNRAVATSSRPKQPALSSESRERTAFKISKQSTGGPPAPKSEAWYNKYLLLSANRSTKPRCPYDSPNAALSESKLCSVFRVDPMKLFDSESLEHADLGEAGKCLNLYIARHSPTQGETLAQTREHYVRDRPGSRGLAWSCSLPDAERKALWGDNSFISPVTHFLVAEGAIASLWNWLKLDISIGPKDPFGDGFLRWKQDVLRTMVAAQVFWTESTDYWSDAIKSVLESQTMQFGIGRPAAVFLYKTIIFSNASAIDPVLYDKLACLITEIFPDENGLEVARFDLRHPVRPSTAKFLKLLQTDVDCNQLLEQWFNPKTAAAGYELNITLIRLAQRCLAEGYRTNAERVLDLGYERVPHLFSGKGPYENFTSEAKKTPLPPPIRRKPTQAEIAAGKEVDADGNVLVSPAAYAYWKRTCRM